MKIAITYYGSGGYLTRATSLAVVIEEAKEIESVLIQGSGGVFDIVADGEPLFSKHTEGRSPDVDEILVQIP